MPEDSSKPSENHVPPPEKREEMMDGIDKTLYSQIDREKIEPEEQYNPVNMTLIFLFAGLMFWAGLYLANYSGNWDPMVYNEEQWGYGQAGGEKEELPLPELGAKVFKKNCVQCHQANGEGVPGAFPTFVGSKWVLGPKERVINILLSGLNGPIVVKGTEYNGNMPNFGNQLKEREIAGVLTYIRTQSEWGNDASAVSLEDVQAVVAEQGIRGKPWTANELLELYPDPE